MKVLNELGNAGVELMIEKGRAAIAAEEATRLESENKKAVADKATREAVLGFAKDLMPNVSEYLHFLRWGTSSRSDMRYATIAIRYVDAAEIWFTVLVAGKTAFYVQHYWERIESVSMVGGSNFEIVNYRVDHDDFGDAGFYLQAKTIEYHEDVCVTLARAVEIKDNKAAIEAECAKLNEEAAAARAARKDQPAPVSVFDMTPEQELTRALRQYIAAEIERSFQ
jgi:hypothetical protein